MHFRKVDAGSFPEPSPGGVFPIVGVGASAGGLEAFTHLLQNLPVDTGMAFVLVQHLDPAHESALTSLLAKATAMPVAEVKNGLKVAPNRVYVIPPNRNMAISRGVLGLQPRRNTAGAHRSIDFFFESLAQDQKERAIGVVLSGTATDGTHGTEMIKAEGGITFAQDDSARYDSMPRSAVAAGCIDFVLSPAGIAQELTEIARHPLVSGKGLLRRKQAPRVEESARLPVGDANTFKKILDLLRHHRGVDFSLYKPNTIERRITRRMVLNKSSALGDYAAFLKGNQKEIDLLYADVLISVTSFFRNPEAFDALKTRVFPQLLRDRKRDDPVRVWTLGCSTGQEAYSIAMAYMEFAGDVAGAPRLQVFATDLNEPLLDKARHGLYSKSLAGEISPERLRRFFTEEQGGYRISKPLRETCVFARQNILNDPPFSRMDLISCRNLMIYIEPHLQKKILPNFHYALKPGGFLFLGASESIGPFTDLFEAVDKKQKIFAKKNGALPAYHLPVSAGRPAQKKGAHARPQTPPDGLRIEATAQREADRIVASHFAPPGVLINAEMEVLQFRGATSAYVGPPPGKASFNLLKMARPELMLPLRAAINRAKKENCPVLRKNVRLDGDGPAKTVNIQVIPLKNLKEICYLVLFEPARKSAETDRRELPAAPEKKKKGSPALPAKDARRVGELERELAEARDYAQSLQEQHEAANEELQASNEEVQSANEELQSINEELETSKEELESTNEELTTVNEEMATRNTELNRLNSDLNNLHVSINTGILLLSRDLAIRRFTPVAERIFNLLPADLGRPLSGIRHSLDFPGLEKFVTEVIDTVTVREREVQDREGRWFMLRARPYLTLDNKIDGAVLVLTDIDDLKFKEQEIREARDYAQGIVETVPPLLILDEGLHVLTANDSFYKHFGVTQAHTENVLIYELEKGQWNIPRLRRLLEGILPRNSFFEDFEVTHDFGSRGKRTLLLSGRRLENTHRILLSIDDITERLRLEESVRRSELRYRRLFETAQDGILMLDPKTRKITAANPFMVDFLGYALEELIGKELWEIGLFKDETASREAFRRLKENGSIRYEDMAPEAQTGRRREVEFISNLYLENNEEVIQCNIRDMTERKRTEEALRASEQRYRALFELGPVAVYSCDTSGMIQEFNSRAVELWGRKPKPGDTDELFCGSHKMFRPDGSFMPHEQYPMAEVIAGKIPVARNVEEFIERPDGSRITVVVNISPLKNQRGKIVGAINCFYDITERKKTEEALRKSEGQYRTLFNSIDEGFCVIEMIFDEHERPLDYRFLEVNPSFEKHTGLHDVIGKRMRELRPNHEAYWFETYGKIALTGKSRRFVSEAKALDRWFDVYGFRLGGQEDRKVGIIFNDITERKRAEMAAASLAAIVESSDDAIISKDLNSVITSWNKGAERLFGYTAQEIIGQSIYRLIPLDRQPEETKIIEQIKRGETVNTFETVRLRKDGSLLEVSLTISPLRNASGQVIGASKIARDITERKKAEETLRRAQAQLSDHAGELEKAVAARTSELTSANKQMEAFVYSIAHDLRAPLRAMEGFSSMLVEEAGASLSEAGHDYAKRISRSAQFMDSLLMNLLTFSRVSQQRVELTAVDPETAINAELSRLENEIEEKKARVEVKGPWPLVLAHEPTLNQVLFNLLSNALKFSKRGTPALIRIWPEEAQGAPFPSVRIWVEDNGIGIAPEHQEETFRLFTRLHGDKFPGTGFGLAIVQKGVEHMGGRVGVESAVGKGARFWFELQKA